MKEINYAGLELLFVFWRIHSKRVWVLGLFDVGDILKEQTDQ